MEDKKNEAPYKVEPEIIDSRETINECREVADKFKIESFGGITGDSECQKNPEVPQ